MEDSPDNLESGDAELEDYLLATPLRRPSALLGARVKQTVARRNTRIRQRWRLVSGLAAMFIITASVLLTLHPRRQRPLTGAQIGVVVPTPALPHSRPGPPAALLSTASARPLRIMRTLSTVADDGVVATLNGQPVQRLRQVRVEQVVVFDPARGFSVVYRRPCERVVLVAGRAF